jgi:hypothetical protein
VWGVAPLSPPGGWDLHIIISCPPSPIKREGTMSDTLSQIAATSRAITTEIDGRISWECSPGQHVTMLQRLGWVTSEFEEMEITSPITGKIAALMYRAGTTVGAGTLIAYVRPLARAAIQVPTLVPREPEPQIAAPPPITPLPARPHRDRTTRRTYHLAESQVEAVRELSLKLRLEPDRTIHANESELVRTALAMLLELPAPALQEMIRANKQREKSGRYGSGFPRPSNNRRSS